MQKRSAFVGVMAVLLLSVISQAQMQIYGAWHCGSDFCTWASVRNMIDFDTKNHWIIDRGDGSPSVNLIILSFVNPLRLLNLTNDSQTSNGVPIGMNSAVDLFSTFAGRANDLAPWLADASINRDRNLRLQFLAGLGLNLYQSDTIYAGMLAYVHRFPDELFTGSPDTIRALRAGIQREQGR